MMSADLTSKTKIETGFIPITTVCIVCSAVLSKDRLEGRMKFSIITCFCDVGMTFMSNVLTLIGFRTLAIHIQKDR